MAKRDTSGLIKRGKIWHIQKRIKGIGRLYESTGASDRAEAERYLAHRLGEIRNVVIYGERPTITFREAAAKFIDENAHLRSLRRYALSLDTLDPYIGDLPLEQVHDDTLAPFRKARVAAGIRAGTINRDLGAVRRILNLAARKWRHQNGKTYLSSAPLLDQAKGERRRPYPLSWVEQKRFLQELPGHLEQMALFDLNTGLRDQELVSLRWYWEVQVPELECSVFILPEEVTKNGEERVLMLNRVARSVLEAQRGRHAEYVFTFGGKPLTRMNNTSWRKARRRAELPNLRVHDMRHTFGHRLRAAGVSIEDRKALLGHKVEDITTHYSAPDLAHLLKCVDQICDQNRGTVLRVWLQNGGKNGGKLRCSTSGATSA
jgi:integrase